MRIFHVNINCADLSRSIRFYQMLGFSAQGQPAPAANSRIAAGLGLQPTATGVGVLMTASGDDSTALNLIQWDAFTTSERPAADAIGLARISLLVDDVHDVVDALGPDVSVVGPEVRTRIGGGARFICVRDPDGTLVELFQFDAAPPMPP